MMEPAAASTAEFDERYAAEQIRRSRDPLRRKIKKIYLDKLLGEVVGPTLDFGCGAGQLLERLPEGSAGIEINPFLLPHLKSRGLDARHYDAFQDRFRFTGFESGGFQTLVLSHVLEHFEDAVGVMSSILNSCRRMNVRRVVVVVPGRKGYRSDATHKTFIDRRWIEEHVDGVMGYEVADMRHFPLDIESIGIWFVFHELHVVLERLDD